MIDPTPTATYRIQMRGGTHFADIQSRLDYFCKLGISHLYLSPIFAANAGSTHGYDVIDPTVIEATLGGRDGFQDLANAAHASGLGIILDIVPNHTAFSLENPWLRDVLQHGQASRYASHFDINWSVGPLALPFLPEPFAAMLNAGRFSAQHGSWVFDDVKIPLAADGPQQASSTEDLLALHALQHWRLRHWETERDSITHRRFFNVTGLIGMRVEDAEVFRDTHSLIVDLVKSGYVDGLRVDHIDGLVDPKSYLDRLARKLPDTPIWVEKILVGQESLPENWPTAGTTGYEAGRLLARLLTHPDAIDTLDDAWRQSTAISEDFSTALSQAKTDILFNELAAELHQLIALGTAALADDPDVEAGPESLREAVIALLTGMSRYRTYIDDNGANPLDHQLLADIADKARPALRSPRVLDHLIQHMLTPANGEHRAFALRFQQVSGALLAKAQEDTAGFRWTRFLAGNEVGAEPDDITVTDAEANIFLAARRPSDMNLTSSHDTKRSEDARTRLVAISHHPAEFAHLVQQARQFAPEDAVTPAWQWYIAQSTLAIWGAEPHALQQRLAEHIRKAMREAKQTTFWTRPVDAIENPAINFAAALCEHWRDTRPVELDVLLATGDALSLTQLALKCLMPGFPDIYRGCEAPYYTLTDPDSRLPVDWSKLESVAETTGFAGDKARLTRTLLKLRKIEHGFFANARAEVATDTNRIRFTRATPDRTLVLEQSPTPATIKPDQIWRSTYAGHTLTIGWQAQ
ncbi:malto-oligosyltrehalose synthase [Devosia neptuniae]|jgi:(1->4)-alpha-D-glucan 1-alpha-D-glucosylmutase|uniref:malto-oligosyltrehalose synthase n=1 Tax=Devosia TaxID=46913 RepID=UPI0022AE5F86|nr:malto-oligosyltrehalose synthase [Devosia neptuniae]MCZ4345616.1 malto-oligosyltrehalose synthase [Devosia neptuniae]|tara:strand:- start:71448 stop:73703 length:2256 start_codon:yes stop_codon:yes gene_type:complete